jgi:hypothetical protein
MQRGDFFSFSFFNIFPLFFLLFIFLFFMQRGDLNALLMSRNCSLHSVFYFVGLRSLYFLLYRFSCFKI